LRQGAGAETGTDLSEFALWAAAAAGADRTVNAGMDAGGLAACAEGRGRSDVAFECSGSESALRADIGCLRPGGLPVQIGLGGDLTVPMMALTAKELRIRGSFRFHEESFTAAALMRKGLVDLKPLLTATPPPERALEAFEPARDRGLSMKAQLECVS